MKNTSARWLWLLLLVAVIFAAVVSTSRRRGGPPFDPDSTEPDGARALIVVLEGTGVDVTTTETVPDVGDSDVVFVLGDRMPDEQVRDVEAFARSGGRVVVADGYSSLSPQGSPMEQTEHSGGCADGSLENVGTVESSAGPRGFRVVDLESGVACFVEGGTALVVVEPLGEGHVVSVGDPHIFTNRRLDEADNSVLAAELAGGDGSRMTFLTPAPAAVGSGTESLIGLIPNSVKAIGWQALIAFGFGIWWKGRRLGLPVEEPQPVTIAGSELTRAVGRLLESNNRPDRAAALLRDRARSDMAHRLGLTNDSPAALVADAIERATSLTPTEIEIATVAPVTDDQQLLTVARLLSRIREEVLHDTHTTDR